MASGAVKEPKVDGSTATTPEDLDRTKLSFKPICIIASTDPTISSGLVPVTFDNNGDQNYWSYHTKDSNYSNVSELFHMEYVGQTDNVGPTDNVKILGYLPPPTSDRRAVAWYLTIRENANGSTDSYPTFAPQLLDPQKRGETIHTGETILHTEYTKHDHPNTTVNTFGLSFKTQKGKTYYLEPHHSKKRMGVSSSAQYPFFVGETGAGRVHP